MSPFPNQFVSVQPHTITDRIVFFVAVMGDTTQRLSIIIMGRGSRTLNIIYFKKTTIFLKFD